MNGKTLRRAAIGAVALGGVRAARRIAGDQADRRFMHIDLAEDTVHEVGTVRYRLPAAFRRTDGFAAYYRADIEAVEDLLPSPSLHAVRVDRTHGIIAVFAFRHFEIAARATDGSTISLPPYGEVGAYAPVTRRAMPPFIPALLEWAADRPMSGFILQLPVTSRLARDSGRWVWGMPKFMADMAFAEDGVSRGVHVSEGGRPILDLRVEVGGDARRARGTNVLYSVLDGRLLETRMESRAFTQRAFGARAHLRLGDHPATAVLKSLGLAEGSLGAGIVVQQRFLMPEGRDLGPASEPERYLGADVERGAFTTRSADGMVVDHYAALGLSVGPNGQEVGPKTVQA